jgi:hypothetical protein
MQPRTQHQNSYRLAIAGLSLFVTGLPIWVVARIADYPWFTLGGLMMLIVGVTTCRIGYRTWRVKPGATYVLPAGRILVWIGVITMAAAFVFIMTGVALDIVRLVSSGATIGFLALAAILIGALTRNAT